MSFTSKPLVFVTGASGFLGSQVVYQLLEAGYPVRGAARGAKVSLLQDAFAKYASFTAVEVHDIASTDLTETLKGVGAIIHTAAPLPGRADVETTLKTAIEGSVHVLREGVKAGIPRAVITSSVITFSPTGPWDVNDWNSISKEEAYSGSYWSVYDVGKTLADKAVFEFADTHAAIDVTILSPSWIFGPFAPGFEHLVPTPDFKSFSTNAYIYGLLRPENTHYNPSPGFVDVRDVARAHILALDSKPSSVVGRKRYALISSEDAYYSTAIKLIAEERPELRERLADPAKARPDVKFEIQVVREGLEEAVGFKADDYTKWRETVLDTVDSLVRIEEFWKAKGCDFEMPQEAPF